MDELERAELRRRGEELQAALPRSRWTERQHDKVAVSISLVAPLAVVWILILFVIPSPWSVLAKVGFALWVSATLTLKFWAGWKG